MRQYSAKSWVGRCAVVLVVLVGFLVAGCSKDLPRFFAGDFAYKRGDYVEAMRYYRPIAEGGNLHAQFNLGLMYEKGQGVPQNSIEALKWYSRAAE